MTNCEISVSINKVALLLLPTIILLYDYHILYKLVLLLHCTSFSLNTIMVKTSDTHAHIHTNLLSFSLASLCLLPPISLSPSLHPSPSPSLLSFYSSHCGGYIYQWLNPLVSPGVLCEPVYLLCKNIKKAEKNVENSTGKCNYEGHEPRF